MNIQKKVEYDQEKIKMLIADIENLGTEATDLRKPLFHKLKQEIHVLHTAEEEVVFEVVQDDAEEITDALESENKKINQIMQDIEKTPENDNQWHDEFARLKEKVLSRIEHEQDDLMPIMDKSLGDQESEALAEELSEEKDDQVNVDIQELPQESGPTKKRHVS